LTVVGNEGKYGWEVDELDELRINKNCLKLLIK